MCALDRLTTALQSVVGAEYLLTEDTAAAYAVDGVAPSIVALPGDEEQVAAVMRLTAEHQASVFPRGGGSHQTLGHTPKRVDVVLGVQRLQQQIAYEPADMTTTVQAGLRLADLQQTLGTHGQFLALDPPAAATTTVGGTVAANMSGPRRLLYGSARDLVLGIAVIMADGTRTKAGGRVVKNVTGYDLNKLYIGSLGTLAVIVELTFKLHPLPPGEHTIGIALTAQADLAAVLHTVMQLPLRLNSLELLNAAAISWLTHSAALPAIDTPYLLIARVEGLQEVTARQQQRLVDALQTLPAAGPLTVHTWEAEAQTSLWRTLAEFPVAMPASSSQSVLVKASLGLSGLPALLQAAARAGTAWPVLAHAGNGIAYVSIPAQDSAVSDVADLLGHLRALDTCIASLQGRRVIHYAPVAIKRQCEVWGSPGDDFALMRAIKASFDPHQRLNPGRFIGGL